MGISLSIIVAVYNVEEYLPQCIDSILAQEYKDYELILVDDGSTDLSGQICDEYAKRTDFQPSIRVVHKQNGGLPSARNAGLDIAKGEYTAFVDGDDFLIDGSLKGLMQYTDAQKYDVLMSAFLYCDINGEMEKSDLPCLVSGMDTIEKINAFFSSKDTVWQAWRNMVRTEFIRENNMRFDIPLTSGEDCDFFLNLCKNSARFCICDVVLIGYRINRQGSLMNQLTPDRFHSIVTAYDRWYRYLYDFGRSAAPANTRLSNAYYYMILQRVNRTPTLVDEAQRYMYLLGYVTGIKRKIIVWLYKVLGIKLTLKILGKGESE